MHPTNLNPSQCLEYFFKPDPILGVDSVWSGYLAKEYGIDGSPCKKTNFANLICGNNLKGNPLIKLGRDEKDNPLHRAAVDCTFSPPKSFSIVALHVGDDRLITGTQQSLFYYLQKS